VLLPPKKKPNSWICAFADQKEQRNTRSKPIRFIQFRVQEVGRHFACA